MYDVVSALLAELAVGASLSGGDELVEIVDADDLGLAEALREISI